VRTFLTSEDDFSVSGEAADGLASVEQAAKPRRDVILMDVRTPGIDGLEATRRILTRTLLATTRIIVLTTFERDEYMSTPYGSAPAAFCSRTPRRSPCSTLSARSPTAARCCRARRPAP
jgi:DNA-binding NarL/FixJ family response regulator